MDLHPIFIHFPIALLTLWSVIEILRLTPLLKNKNLGFSQGLLIVVGTVGAFMALQTGEGAEHLRTRSNLIEMHSTFADIATYLYAVFALEALLPSVTKFLSTYVGSNISKLVYKFSALYSKIISNPALRIILIVAAFAALLITGILGGVIVYGTTSDPLSPYILQMLGL